MGPHNHNYSYGNIGLSLSQTNLDSSHTNFASEETKSTHPDLPPLPTSRQRRQSHDEHDFDHHGTPRESAQSMSSVVNSTSPTSSFPRLMLLTVAEEPKRPCEMRVGVDDFSPVDGWLSVSQNGPGDNSAFSSLDGVYLQFQEEMMTPEGAASLRKLSERYLVGIWGYSGQDPDNYETFMWLVEEGNATYVNTDLPTYFRKDIIMKQSSTISE